MEEKTSLRSNALIWFGAGISIAEIMTGTSFAPLGMTKGFLAILIGHVIGAVLMYLAGLIGARSEKSAMETVKLSFGSRGGYLFSILNIIQLAGWTAIMIYDGAQAADGVFHQGAWIWCVIIGGLIILWLMIGLSHLGKLNTIAMGALFLLTIVLCKVIFLDHSGSSNLIKGTISFGAAIELGVAMPLSWLPLISDYTSKAKKPVKAVCVSVLTYSLISCFMYLIGMGAAIYTGEIQIASIMSKAGLGIAALIIVVLSTVTTTFLDAYSAGISAESIDTRWKGKLIAIGVTIIGMIGAISYPMDDITDFLYLIGSVFAPMIAIQIVDYFIFHRAAITTSFDWIHLAIWVCGFVLYRYLLTKDLLVGNTLPDIVATMLLTGFVDFILYKVKEKQSVIQ
ncbi:predicted hydroxymethylpyrimidine transporter CytX [Lachnospiraceae bacterium KM106-2]|nr:predicted hydroxymethylpyrimidine transporter CytX [Lachnospiraceae bacterium KM106-2]